MKPLLWWLLLYKAKKRRSVFEGGSMNIFVLCFPNAWSMRKASGRTELCKSISLLMISICSSSFIVSCNAHTGRESNHLWTKNWRSQWKVKWKSSNERLPVNGETGHSLLFTIGWELSFGSLSPTFRFDGIFSIIFSGGIFTQKNPFLFVVHVLYASLLSIGFEGRRDGRNLLHFPRVRVKQT